MPVHYIKLDEITIDQRENSSPKTFENLKVIVGQGRSDLSDELRHFSFSTWQTSSANVLSKCDYQCKPFIFRNYL